LIFHDEFDEMQKNDIIFYIFIIQTEKHEQVTLSY